MVLDGGPCTVGIESTIVDVTGSEPAILRVGGVSQAQLEAAIGRAFVLRTSGETAAPGTLESHYAPAATVEIVDAAGVTDRALALAAAGQRVGVLASADTLSGLPPELAVLDAPRDVDEYARSLYARLRAADDLELDVLLVVLPPESEALGAAVADRVRRAAT